MGPPPLHRRCGLDIAGIQPGRGCRSSRLSNLTVVEFITLAAGRSSTSISAPCLQDPSRHCLAPARVLGFSSRGGGNEGVTMFLACFACVSGKRGEAVGSTDIGSSGRCAGRRTRRRRARLCGGGCGRVGWMDRIQEYLLKYSF
jgi:hypothetical protein